MLFSDTLRPLMDPQGSGGCAACIASRPPPVLLQHPLLSDNQIKHSSFDQPQRGVSSRLCSSKFMAGWGVKASRLSPTCLGPTVLVAALLQWDFGGEIAGIVEKKGLKERFGENFPGEVFPG